MEPTTRPASPAAGPPRWLACERRAVYALLMTASGMMGAYTLVLRGGVFCNAQTANIAMMAIAFGQARWADGLYYLIPLSAYCLGTFLSELLPGPVKRLGGLRWDTWLVLLEAAALFGVGFVPLYMPHQPVQVLINFFAAMQFNTFRQAEGIPMATTFCTNHVRQAGVWLCRGLRGREPAALRRAGAHLVMLLCFFWGAALLAALCPLLQQKAIWLALCPLLAAAARLLYADLFAERELLPRKPAGH